MCADKALIAHYGAIENGGPHSNQDFVTHGAGVKDRAVTDRHEAAQDAGIVIGKVKDGIVLDIAVMADDDAVDISPGHGVIPDAGVIAHGNITQHHGSFGNIHPIAQGRFFAEESLELFFQFFGIHFHAVVLTE
jgi:hypothetical protein